MCLHIKMLKYSGLFSGLNHTPKKKCSHHISRFRVHTFTLRTFFLPLPTSYLPEHILHASGHGFCCIVRTLYSLLLLHLLHFTVRTLKFVLYTSHFYNGLSDSRLRSMKINKRFLKKCEM